MSQSPPFPALGESCVDQPSLHRGSAVQQVVSALTILPEDMFQGSGQQFHTIGESPHHFLPLAARLTYAVSPGVEYWTDPSNPTEGFITWQLDGQPTVRLGAAALGPDTDPKLGSGVGQRLIPEEPMVRSPYLSTLATANVLAYQSIVLNLGLSRECARRYLSMYAPPGS